MTPLVVAQYETLRRLFNFSNELRAIFGDSGMGKTMLMQRFCDDHPPLLDQRKGIER